MAIALGQEAPNFTAETTDGKLDFHEYLGDSWGVLFSHPKDFTPVCTTELGRVAALKPEFEGSNAYAATVWEGELLRRHYCPQVVEALKGVEGNVKEALKG